MRTLNVSLKGSLIKRWVSLDTHLLIIITESTESEGEDTTVKINILLIARYFYLLITFFPLLKLQVLQILNNRPL